MKFITLIITALCICSAGAGELTKSISLFDGKTLNGWKVVDPNNKKMWSVVDGAITSGNLTDNIPTNTYLATKKQFEDFEFHCQFRIQGDHATGLINSGIQYRSTIENNNIVGYQADIGKGYWGGIYDEHRRNKELIAGDISGLKDLLKEDGWNSYTIRCVGSRHQLFINGVMTADYTEEDPEIPSTGHIAVQIHSGGAAKVEFKDLTIKKL